MSQFEIACEGRVLRVGLNGDFTAALLPELKPAVQKALETGATEAVFDLANTEVLDSSGIGFMIATYNSLAKKGGATRVINVSADIMGLMQSMRLDKRLGVSGK